jgi:hypothetical protein
VLKLCLPAAILTLLLLQPPPSFSAENTFQIWTPIFLDGRIHGKVRGYFELQPRMSEGVGQMSQLIIRPGLEYRFSPGASAFVGYAWIGNYRPYVQENRIWQQLLFNKSIKQLKLTNRSRLEERIFEQLPSAGVRLRHLVKGTYPINPKIYLATSYEMFVNLNSVAGGPQRGLDQNRYFAGLGHNLSNSARVEVGYQLQHVKRPGSDLCNHTIIAQLFYGLRD